MPAINLNTASYEDLLELEGIGQHRATAILKLREEKGCITEDDIRQSLQGTYSTIRTLLDEENVSLDIPSQLLQTLKKGWDDQMEKMSSDFKEQMKASQEHYKSCKHSWRKT